MTKQGKFWVYGIISEIAFFAVVYYIQTLWTVDQNLWVSSFIIWALINISIIFCPVLNKDLMK